ncbi:MAG: hypothetical protein R2755_07525 [Acidimicrobiales bacterium]
MPTSCSTSSTAWPSTRSTPRRDAAAADRRRSMMTAWARLSQGFLGRSPDHVAGLLAGFAAAPEAFTDELAANVVVYQRRVATEDLYPPTPSSHRSPTLPPHCPAPARWR